MEKSSIKRENLKHNFLKQIIIRADYRGVDEVEITQILPQIKDYLNSQNYVKYRTEVAKEIDFQLEYPNTDMEFITKSSNVRQTIVHVFQNKESGIFVKISSSFVFATIEMAKYQNCLKYCTEIEEIINYIKIKAKFFELVRFGIRKINQCILLDVSKLNDYFEDKLFRLYNINELTQSKTFQSKDCFAIKDLFDVNLICTIVCGEINDQTPAYQVTFDSDIYLLEEHCLKLQDSFSSTATEMNEFLFEIYKEAITLPFLEKLMKPDFVNNDEINGVEKND